MAVFPLQASRIEIGLWQRQLTPHLSQMGSRQNKTNRGQENR